ncbi:MAG: Uncharacterized protein G01um1014107_68 [Parcubacteria group bacterium Gr01-1014_107]|nr:MAG: Uncharacterized protein G01um1014107_68 [Parcubacteria group bacterium Gr01-1014_107]
MLVIKSIIKDKDSELDLAADRDFFTISKKTGRLASAIYLLTDFLSDIEPLKWCIRKWILRVVTETLSLKKVYTAEQKTRQLEGIKVDIEKISSLLEMAQMSGLISEMNFRIIFDELVNIAKLEERYVSLALRPRDRGYNLEEKFLEGISNRPDIKDNMSYKNVLYGKGHSTLKNKPVSERTSGTDFTGVNRTRDILRQMKTDRQVKILDIIKDRKEVSIKDMTGLIKDCSEKTIQRELISMVNSGVLRRNGKRRWSKYSLNL